MVAYTVYFLLTLEDEIFVFAQGNIFIFYVIYCNSNVPKL